MMTCNLPAIRFAKQNGMTLLEIVVATMITGAMLVASLNSVGAVFQTQKLNADRLKGPGLAHELMSEILAMPYKDPTSNTAALGTEAGESTANRLAFDDVDDYDGLNTMGIKAKSGTTRTGYSTWREQVSVQWIETLTGLAWILGDTGLKRITVTITSPDGEVTQLLAYRYKEGALERAPMVDTSAVTWMGAELRLGGVTTPVRMGTNLTNHTPDAD
jgi:type II secretory pathway pseudopilin PulG